MTVGSFLIIYFVVCTVLAFLCAFSWWYRGNDIKGEDFLLGTVIAYVPVLNLYMYSAAISGMWEYWNMPDWMEETIIKGRGRE